MAEISKTIFQTRYRQYKFLMLSFRLINSPTTFMDLITKVIWNYLESFVIVFINDILVYSWNREEHAQHLRVVLQNF